MTALQTNSPLSGRVGAQVPRLHYCPPHDSDGLGERTIQLARLAGLTLDPWQELVIRETSFLAGGKHAAFEVGLIVPRQNGKGAIIEADQLKSLFLDANEMTIYSAHQFKTAKAMYRRIRELIESTPELHRRVKAYRQSNEETGIELRNGCRLNFFARSAGSGRGFSAPKMYFDEAYDLSPELIGDMIPTLSAMPSPQIWYASSAGKTSSEQLAKIRERGISGKPGRLAFYEWSSPEGTDLDDVDALYESNPALGYRLDLDFIREVERASMADDEFGRERYGMWQGTRTPAVIDSVTWQSLAAVEAEIVGEVSFGIDVSPDRSHASIGVSGYTLDGRRLVEYVEGRASADWIVSVAAKISEAQRPKCFVVDAGSPAGSLVESLLVAGVPVVTVGAREYAHAAQRLYDEAFGGLLVHLNQPPLNTALAAGRKRPIGSEGAWAWHRVNADADITPLVAVTLAGHGLSQKIKVQNRRRGHAFAF